MSNLAAISNTFCVVERPHEDRVGQPGALDVVDQQVELTRRHLVRVGLVLDQRRYRQAQPQQILGLGVGRHGALLVVDSLRDNNGEMQLIARRERKKPPNFPDGPSCLATRVDQSRCYNRNTFWPFRKHA